MLFTLLTFTTSEMIEVVQFVEDNKKQNRVVGIIRASSVSNKLEQLNAKVNETTLDLQVIELFVSKVSVADVK